MRLFATLFLCALVLAGCNSSGPKSLTVEEIPPALKEAFQSAALLVRQNANSIATLVEQKQYALATIQLQALLPQELSKEQRRVASGALQSLNAILQEQAAGLASAGDEGTPPLPREPVAREEAEAAAAVMNHYIRTK